MITFSIITVTYNAASVVQRTLDSVLSQTYHDVEHFIIDGASKDDTVAVAKKYKEDSDASANGHQVVILSEPDHGIYDAMNKGLARATGDYVLFLNAGDYFPDGGTMQQIADNCRLNDYTPSQLPAVLYGNTDIVDGEGRFLHPRHLQPPKELTWKSFRHGMLVCHQAFYARTDIAKTIQYDLRYRFSADVDWCIRVMHAADCLHLPLVNSGIVVACYTEEGATTRNHRASLRERFDVMRRHYGLLSTIVMHAWFVVRNLR
jgi:glycosyltransferase involved in cell wall biosynthesis